MSMKEGLPKLEGYLADVLGDELAHELMKVACEICYDEIRNYDISNDLAIDLSAEQREQALAVLDNYPT